MRTILNTLCLTSILTVAACGGAADEQPPAQPPPPPVQPAPPPADTAPPPAQADTTPPPKPAMADLVKNALAAAPAAMGDAQKFAALYAPDATLWTAGMPELKGHDAIQAYYQGFFDAESGEKLTITRAFVKGNMYASEWILTGTQSKDFNGVPASDKPWGIAGASVVWLNDDGLITKDHLYWDLSTYIQQVTGSKDKSRPIPDAPTGAVETHVAKGDATEDKNVAAVNKQNADFSKPDVKAALDAMADDGVFVDFASPKPSSDKGHLKAFLTAAAKAFPDMKSTGNNVFGVEDFTIDEYENVGTQKAPLVLADFKLPNTKKSFDTHGIDIFQWKDGKIAKSWTYQNHMEFAAQAGLLDKPAAKTADAKGANSGKGGKPAKGAADATKPAK